jgi:hypothetical protein
MKHLGKLIALTAVALAFAGTTAAQADPGIQNHMKVDGTITLGPGPDVVCTWTNGSTSDNPPNTLTVYRNTINPPGGNNSCTGASSVTLDNDPVIMFDDANGKAKVDRVRTTGIRFGVSCTYEATDVMLMRDGTTRRYTGSFTATRLSGSEFFCPSSQVGTADITFH